MAVTRALENLKKALDSPELRRRLDRAVSESDKVTVASLAQRGFLQLGEDTVLGAVNLNTAPRVVLGSLPGLDDTIAAQWVQEREKRQSRLRLGESVILFRCPSDLLADPAFWQADARSEQRLGRLTGLLGVVTFSTSSVFLDSHTAVGQQAGSAGRRPTVSRALALVAFDRGRPEFVAWSQLP